MIPLRIRVLLVVAVIVGSVLLGSPGPARAAFQIRVTELNKLGVFEAKSTVSFASGPGSSVTAMFDGKVGAGHGAALPDFNLEVVTNTSSTGTDFSRHDTAINITYKAGAPLGVGKSDQLLIEVLGDSYINPTAPELSQITSNGSTSSSGTAKHPGLSAGSVTMTSGVINGNVVLSGTNGATLGSQLGMTTGTGSIVTSLSNLFIPNPSDGAPFAIADPFTFYQTYRIKDVTNSGSGSLTGASEVDAIVPEPQGVILALAALSILGGYGWLRRRKAVQIA